MTSEIDEVDRAAVSVYAGTAGELLATAIWVTLVSSE